MAYTIKSSFSLMKILVWVRRVFRALSSTQGPGDPGHFHTGKPRSLYVASRLLGQPGWEGQLLNALAWKCRQSLPLTAHWPELVNGTAPCDSAILHWEKRGCLYTQ